MSLLLLTLGILGKCKNSVLSVISNKQKIGGWIYLPLGFHFWEMIKIRNDFTPTQLFKDKSLSTIIETVVWEWNCFVF